MVKKIYIYTSIHAYGVPSMPIAKLSSAFCKKANENMRSDLTFDNSEIWVRFFTIRQNILWFSLKVLK